MHVVTVVVALVTAIEVTALDLHLFQRARRSNDAQNEHEKGHGNQGRLAHVAQIVVGATTALWGAISSKAPSNGALYQSQRVEEPTGAGPCAVCRKGGDSSHHIEGTGTVHSGGYGD